MTGKKLTWNFTWKTGIPLLRNSVYSFLYLTTIQLSINTCMNIDTKLISRWLSISWYTSTILSPPEHHMNTTGRCHGITWIEIESSGVIKIRSLPLNDDDNYNNKKNNYKNSNDRQKHFYIIIIIIIKMKMVIWRTHKNIN